MLSLTSTKKQGLGLTSVIAAVTGDKSDAETVSMACELLGDARGTVHVVHVIEVARDLPVDAEVTAATTIGEEILKDMEEVTARFKCNSEAELLQSRKAGHAIVQEAVDKSVDAIVLGTPFKQQYGSFTLGETLPYVLENAPCRVIVWRGQAPGTAVDDMDLQA